MLGETGVDQCDYRLRDSIRRKAATWRHIAWARCTEGLPVVGVKAPLAADRHTAVHQHVMAFTLFAVKMRHAQRFTALGMGSEVAHAAEKMPVLAQVQGQLAGNRGRPDGLQHTPIARCSHNQGSRPQALHVRLQLGL